MKFQGQPTALIIDLCGTTILENTTDAFVDRWLRLQGCRHAVRHLTGGKRPVCALALRGLPQKFLYRQGAFYVRDRLRNLANPFVLEAVREAQDRHTPVYLVTASIDPVAIAVGKQLRLDGVLCSRLRYREGLCSGIFAQDVIGRKLVHLLRILPSSMVAGATLYTDNRLDADLIRASAHTYFFGCPAALPEVSQGDPKVTFLVPQDPGGTYVAG